MQQVRDVNQDCSGDWWCRYKFAVVPGIDLQATGLVLKQESAEAEISVRHDPRVSSFFDDFAFYFWVMDQSELWVCALGDGFKKVVTQIHYHRQAFENIHRQNEALGVELV